ncbi:MAG: T9SS type A sorting domain-containing protein [Chitinophagaceae bacterium]
MKKSLLFCATFLVTTFALYSQTDRFAYVITDVIPEGGNWYSLRKIDLRSNAYSDILLNGSDAAATAYDATTRAQLAAPYRDERFGTAANAAFSTGVAAIAYDRKNNRLYYTPMLIDQLRYIDLKTMKVYFAGSTSDALKVKAADQSNIITRMTFASDGNGYALTNDGNHLVRFTTGKTPDVTDLGTLVDDPANKSTSIHNSCSSFGGDMIADDDGNLYVFSARNHVFRINIDTKVSTYLGTVSGLPQSFSTNGAAVTADNRIIVASAAAGGMLYAIDYKTWSATAIDGNRPWRSADLANSNLLVTRMPVVVPPLLSSPEETPDSKIQLYPNPVVNKQFTVQFSGLDGNYTLQVTDVLGRETTRSIININGKGQTETIHLPLTTKAGVYVVKIVDRNTEVVFTRKIVVP